MRAYAGVLMSVVGGESRIILIDEPEAFLHPPLAKLLGRRLAERANDLGGCVIAATHSADFLMGCVQSGVAVNIMRLTYEGGRGSARLLDAGTLTRMMREPLMRSTGVLAGLFHHAVLVTEADGDHAFYQEINERLLDAQSSGIENALFLNAHSVNSVHEIFGPLRTMGVPAAAIVDLDILTDEQKGTFTLTLRAASVPPPLIDSWSRLRSTIAKAYEAAGTKPKLVGVEGLNGGDRDACRTLLASLSEYGVHLVPVGEIEGWLKGTVVSGRHGPDWVTRAFELLGSDPGEVGYVRPSMGDVWDFIRGCRKWAIDPNRKGIPE